MIFNQQKMKLQQINGFDAYVVSFADNSGSKPVIYQVYWVQTDLMMFNVMGVSYPNHSESITGIINSMRKLSADEKAGITGLKIRLAEAKDGESLKDLIRKNQ